MERSYQGFVSESWPSLNGKHLDHLIKYTRQMTTSGTRK